MGKRLLLIVSLFILCIGSVNIYAQTYDQLRKQAEEAGRKGLPQTAIQILDKIYQRAVAEKKTGEMLYAYMERGRYQDQITPDSFYVHVKGMEKWLASPETNQVDCAVLHTVLAKMYGGYAYHNQWQLRQRTDIVNEEPSEDMREWSGNMYVSKVLEHAHAALGDSLLLMNASTKDYAPFVIPGFMSSYYWNDMYHFLAREVVSALSNVVPLEKNGEVNNAIGRINDDLVNASRTHYDITAFLLASLDRLKWKKTSMSVDEYLAALDELITVGQKTALCAEVYLAKVEYLYGEKRYVDAIKVIDEAIAAYPLYRRLNALKEIKQEIQGPRLAVNNSAVAYPGEEVKLNISHKNIDGFTVELYQVKLPTTTPQLSEGIGNDYTRKHSHKMSSQYFKLERPADYTDKDTIITFTAPVLGLYSIKIIPDATQANTVDERLLSVTKLKALSRMLPGDILEVAVLDSKEGTPISGARIRLYEVVKGDKIEVLSLTTDKTGRVETPWKSEFRYLIADKRNDDGMLMQRVYQGYYMYEESKESHPQVKLLTDRNIYRPGQTVYVKGIAYAQQSDTANVLSNKAYTLSLYDVNSREISKKEVRTNEFGSFTAEFALPTGGLNGRYYLQTDGGAVYFRVEEYKRPTFDLTFEKQEESYRLGDSVQVKGIAKTYSGIVLQEVPVQYTITRAIRGWRGWWGRDELIASGEAMSNADGAFSIPVKLVPEKNRKVDEGFYVYTIAATVTNAAGETQTSQTTLAAGSRSLLLSSNLTGLINKDDTIRTTFAATNLSEQPIEVEGMYKLYPITDYEKRTAANESVFSGNFTSNREIMLNEWKSLPSGAYKMSLSANDPQGREATFETEIALFSLSDTRPPVQTDIWYYPISTTFNEVEPAAFIFGTSLKDVYVMVDVFSGNKRIESRVINLSDSISRFDYPYRAKYGNGLTISFAFVKNGKLGQQQVALTRKIPEKELTMKWEVFRDKLRPGQQEEWRLTVKTPQGLPADAELLATMYDASLDKFGGMSQALKPYYRRAVPNTSWMSLYAGMRNYHFNFTREKLEYPPVIYDRLRMNQNEMAEIQARGVTLNYIPEASSFSMKSTIRGTQSMEEENTVFELREDVSAGGALPRATPDIRTNFAETAFFYPQLRTNEQGEIVLSFTMPESLTRWNFRGYAHTKGMLTGMLEGETVTSKDFMLTPNLPRFVRVGDKTAVAASVANLTGNDLSGTVTMTLFDPMTEKVISAQKQKYSVEAGKTGAVSFVFVATNAYDVLGLRLVAEGGSFSDGEQHLLPVLSNKENIVEAIAMPIRGNQTKEFSLQSLFNNNSKTATNRRLTVEFSGTPAWYAVQALPSVSLPTDDNAISWATAYYANSLAAYILNTQPRIKTMFDTWKAQGGTKETFMSNLQKNQDVKAILLEESPWLMEATSETEQMQRIATMFDLNNVQNNNISALNKLKELQLNSGAWAWYKGMSGSRYITTYVVEILARLSSLTEKPLDADMQSMQQQAFQFLHQEALTEYNNIRKAEKDGSKFKGITGTALEYLYLIAISGAQTPDANKAAYNYFLGKVSESITTLSLTDKAHAVVVLHKAGRTKEAQTFIASLKEYAVTTDEQGMHFAFNESPYSWLGLKVPAHVAVMEALDMAGDKESVEEMKLWLLKQKQTQKWDSPVSTVNAVYALLNRGSNLLENRGDVRIALGEKTLDIPASGYLKETFTDNGTTQKPTKAIVEKKDAGIAWGAVYAQYQEDIDKVSRQGGELSVDKKLYVERVANATKQLVPVTADTKLAVGDKVVSRITIRLDRAMDFVQLKDQRGACFEPIESVSGYRWNSGLGYYVSVKDASTNFFFDSLGKGVYVLEYGYRVAREGTYQAGLAVIQSAYAPEYASHSGSVKVEVLR